jgi:hypothetical protein
MTKEDMMSKLVVVHVFNRDTNKSVGGIRVTLSGGYGEKKTDDSGKAVFRVPDDIGYFYIYVSGTEAFRGYDYDIPSDGLNVLVTSSGYYYKTIEGE